MPATAAELAQMMHENDATMGDAAGFRVSSWSDLSRENKVVWERRAQTEIDEGRFVLGIGWADDDEA